MARVYITQGRRDLPGVWLSDARYLHDRWSRTATEGERWGSVLELVILQALALAAQGDEHTALVALNDALDRATPEGYVRIFVDEGAPMHALLCKLKTEGASRTTIYRDTLLAAFLEDLPSNRGTGTHPAPISRYSLNS